MPGGLELEPSPHLPLQEATRSLFNWSNPDKFEHMSEEDLANHISEVRDKAHSITPWPCLKRFHFIVPGIRIAPPEGVYEEVLRRLSTPTSARKPKLLDLGCCFGQDARAVAQDGIDPSQIVASDLLEHFLKLGFELFQDREDQGRIKGMRFQTADVFKEEDLQKLRLLAGEDGKEGRYDLIYCGSFLHLFEREWQVKAVASLSSLLSEQTGSTIFGRQVGVPLGRSGPRPRGAGVGDTSNPMFMLPFRHDKISFKAIFEEQAEAEGKPGMWKVDCRHREFNGLGRGRELGDDEVRAHDVERENLSFVVTRV